MNNLEVTVETVEDARFNYLEVDEIVVLDGNLILVTKKQSGVITKTRWFLFGSKKTETPIYDNAIIALFARGTWRHVFRVENEKSSGRATVEKVARD